MAYNGPFAWQIWISLRFLAYILTFTYIYHDNVSTYRMAKFLQNIENKAHWIADILNNEERDIEFQ